jgi:hypothetical protein
MVAVEIDAGAIMIAAACAMASALLTLIFNIIDFQVSIESRLKDLEHQAEILQYLEEAVLAQEVRIGELEVEASRPEPPSGD